MYYNSIVERKIFMLKDNQFAFYNEKQFAKRLTELRQKKGVSARDMSLSIGQCDSYINRIENGRSLPSMTGFFYICEYLGVTPAEFFSYDNADPQTVNALNAALRQLSPRQSEHILAIVNDIIN